VIRDASGELGAVIRGGGSRSWAWEDDDLKGPRASPASLRTPIFVSQEGRGSSIDSMSLIQGKRNLDVVIGTNRLVEGPGDIATKS
jgi:hypothetical protein